MSINKKFILKVISTICIDCVLLNTDMNAHEAVFKLNTNGQRAVNFLGPGWTDTNILSCVLRCLQIYQSCFSVMFYEHNKYCLPGSSLVTTSAQSQLKTGTIYYNSRVCDADMDFTWYSSNDVGVCLWISTEQLNFNDARKTCTAKDGNLYTMKVNEKIDILSVALNGSVGMFWIGLDDSLRWADDETVITPELRQRLFGAKQPDQVSTGQNCIKYTAGFNTLGGDTCSTSYNYVCELKK
ncbi:unnamed protein product [Lymnaea stagnalis]|uniref:C-type lectin domain-containing protein n=1 Tax=Lymnaea stagnalis TaxID=6523 RepID=A0AAV2GX20_LYMST